MAWRRIDGYLCSCRGKPWRVKSVLPAGSAGVDIVRNEGGNIGAHTLLTPELVCPETIMLLGYVAKPSPVKQEVTTVDICP